jgi:8-oxo-dGTP diphosphatase
MTQKQRAGEQEFLDTYTPGEFPPFALTVDLAIFTIRGGALHVLLVERADHPYRGYWALPGGFVEHDEDVEAAAWRELAEETGVEQFDGYLEQLRTYGEPKRDPRMRVVSVAHVAMAPNLPDPQAGSDAAQARWWAVADLPIDGNDSPDTPMLAFDHQVILTDALERVRAKLEYTTLAKEFVTEPFTLGDLYRVYGAVWGDLPPLGSFRRKVLATDGFVLATNETTPEPEGDGPRSAGRPAALFTAGTATEIIPPLRRPEPEAPTTGSEA